MRYAATLASFLPDIRRQLVDTERLVAARQTQHIARYGEPMSPNNVWLEQRDAEIRGMRLEIAALKPNRPTAP